MGGKKNKNKNKDKKEETAGEESVSPVKQPTAVQEEVKASEKEQESPAKADRKRPGAINIKHDPEAHDPVPQSPAKLAQKDLDQLATGAGIVLTKTDLEQSSSEVQT